MNNKLKSYNEVFSFKIKKDFLNYITPKIKEQKKEITELKKENEQLKKENKELKDDRCPKCNWCWNNSGEVMGEGCWCDSDDEDNLYK